VLDGDTDQLEVRISDSGILSVRQGKTASSNFFFGRGLASADVEITLPNRFWDAVQISTINGDVHIDGGFNPLMIGELSVKTTSGDIDCSNTAGSQTVCKSVSGDIDGRQLVGSIQAETMSGDIALEGNLEEVRAASLSGDVMLRGSVQRVQATAASGDVEIDVDTLPLDLNLTSKSGDCCVAAPGGQGFTLHFETISGDLRSDFPLVGPMASKSGDAIYLDGGDRNFTITSISGDITLKQQ